MSAAFGEGSIPNMDYGECLPCTCDPIAKSQQTAAPTAQRIVANNQIVAVVLTVQFISLADEHYAAQSSVVPWPAELSPGRNALSSRINQSIMLGKPIDFLNEVEVAAILLAAHGYAKEDATNPRSQTTEPSIQEIREMEDLAKLFIEMTSWLHSRQSVSLGDTLENVS